MLRSEKGVSAVEFALISPLLFILTFAIVEFGLLLFDKAVVTNASREGARAAIVYSTNGPDYTPLTVQEVKDVVKSYANPLLINLGVAGANTLSDTDIVITYYDSAGAVVTDAESEGDVKVDVNYTYDFLVFPDLTSLIGGSFSGDIDLLGTTLMRME